MYLFLLINYYTYFIYVICNRVKIHVHVLCIDSVFSVIYCPINV